MSFGSTTFLAFLLGVLVVYYAVPVRARWAALLAAGYLFYLSAGARFVPLLILVTLTTYVGGRLLGWRIAAGAAHDGHATADGDATADDASVDSGSKGASSAGVASSAGGASKSADSKPNAARPARPARRRRGLLAATLVVGVAPLVVCKYTDFLGRSVDSLAAALGLHLDVPAVSLLLPIGISFYTFKSLSYLIEVYRDPSRVERHLGRYALAISFFPQIFAGPIERPTHFLPQLTQDLPFDRERASAGLRLMALGYFKKLVIADHLLPIVNQVYGDLHAHTGLSLVIAALAFSVQIYCDFSGYSDIATGMAQVFGFAPVENFRRPYFARSVQEFWRRWHITLSTWFRDYLYFPLGGNRVHRARYYANLMVVFVVSGLWHGAGWTFVIWGALHGLYLVIGSAGARRRRQAARAVHLDRVPRLQATLAGVLTFGLVTVAWVFFRAASLPDALYVLGHSVRGLGSQLTDAAALRAAVASTGLTMQTSVVLGVSLVALVIVDVVQESGRWSGFWGGRPAWQRLLFSYAVVGWILMVGSFADNPFIYFQF